MSLATSCLFSLGLAAALQLAPLPARADNAAPDANRSSAIGHDLLSPRLPCRGLQCDADKGTPVQPAAKGLRTVYLVFDGITLTAANNDDDATSNVSVILDSVAAPGQNVYIPPFDPNALYWDEGLSKSQIIQIVVSDLNNIFGPYDVAFTTTRPQSGNYHMVVFGGTCGSVAGQSGCAGIAPLDCGDYWPTNIVYAFPSGLRIDDLAATAAQELAHAFGLSHTNDWQDVMYPQIQADHIPDHFGAGPVPDSDPCGGVTYQDSHGLMLQTVGPRGQDVTAPAVLITEPEHGDVVAAGTPVQASITDVNSVVGAELLINNELVASKTSPPWNFSIPAGTPAGEIRVAVRARDDSDNEGSHFVTVYFGNGDEVPCDNGQCDDGFQCIQDLCIPEGDQPGKLGALCEGNEECDSGLCALGADEGRCSQTCDQNTPCPDGFECAGNVACWPIPGEVDEEEGGGCALTTRSRPSGGPGLVALLLAAIIAARRRRR